MDKIKYTKITPESFEGAKHNSMLIDELGQWEKVKGKTFNLGKFICGCLGKDVSWIRFLKGYGVHIQNLKTNSRLTFSERNGYKKYCKLFNYKIKFLKP